MPRITRIVKRLLAASHPRFRKNRELFKNMGGQISHTFPIVSDFSDVAGVAKGHYFHQDLLVAQFIFQRKPQRHLDVGSRIDGFVAHVAAFREIEILDIRPLKKSEHPNIIFVQRDLMSEKPNLLQANSVSCLHSIEHFGLGRYGDTINPEGHKLGFKNLVNMVSKGGTLYISFPIASQSQVHFNAHRVFNPNEIFDWPGSEMLQLERFDFVDDNGTLNKQIEIKNLPKKIIHGRGIYNFKKTITPLKNGA